MSASADRALAWDVDRVRADFPALRRSVRGHPLAYLDNAATALKPESVIAGVAEYYTQVSANVARGVHTPSQEATARFEAVRERVAAFIGAASPAEVVFTAGTTAGLNLVAQSYGAAMLEPGDEILVTEIEHHSNLVPWHLVAARTGAVVRGVPLTEDLTLDLDRLEQMLSDRVRVVAVCHASNVLGTVLPIKQIAAMAHRRGAVVVVDGAQAIPHLPVRVGDLGCDFYAFSAHKLFGPTGLGILWGRTELLAKMPPWQGGGGMIAQVELTGSTYAPPPMRFEAGTPPIAEVYGLGAALDYLDGWDRVAATRYEDALADEAAERLAGLSGVTVYRPRGPRVSVVTFTVADIHPHDIGTALDAKGVAVRAGHHCAQPLMRRLGVPATVRVSFAPYNSPADIDALITGVGHAQRVFGA
ncbi:MAG: SufS family cysteine desulfurase [Gemmatimonadetes bacterium]|nr:SufS family cysteine desulfurase [Gemmatimonadota bacterium]